MYILYKKSLIILNNTVKRLSGNRKALHNYKNVKKIQEIHQFFNLLLFVFKNGGVVLAVGGLGILFF